MEPSKEAIAVRITRLNRLILGKLIGNGNSKFVKRTIDREALLDALTVLYDECNDDSIKKNDELVKAFVDRYRSTVAELRRTRVCFSDFEILQTIGRGHFGEVHMVREKQTNDVYALKSMRKEDAQRRTAGDTDDERDVLASSTSPWIPKLQYAFQDNSNLYLVMELCSGGDLAGLLSRRSTPLSERDAAFYVAEVAHALKTLHGMGYVHRDVKPQNILLDRCGHVKLGDFGSCARLSGRAEGAMAAATADYVAPELLAAADCAATHTVCLQYCQRLLNTAIVGYIHSINVMVKFKTVELTEDIVDKRLPWAINSACDYWSLGVVAFELVTLKRPFSSGEDDSVAQILSNIQKYERECDPEPPFDLCGVSVGGAWRGLVTGLLRVPPARRYNYLDTLQHAALQHLSLHNIRDVAPPWVPSLRGPEDAAWLGAPGRAPPAPSAAPFRARPPFAGQLPFVGYTYVAPEDNDETSTGFNASHDCTAINLATFKSAEKLAAMRGREIAALQSKLAAAEAAICAETERTRRDADAEAERQRAKLQAEITALSLQNRRLERQVEVEKEERMALQRTNQELSSSIAERNSAELRIAHAKAAELLSERDTLREDLKRQEARVAELQAECSKALATADTARAQHQHYKDIIQHVQELRHRWLTEINVRPIDSMAKERALRRQTLSGDAESKEAASRVAAAEANAARETRSRELTERKLATLEEDNTSLQAELDGVRKELAKAQETLGEKQRITNSSTEQLKDVQSQLTQERAKVSSLQSQIQNLQRTVEEASRREAALEEQSVRTESRLKERLEEAEASAAQALQNDARHKEKVTTLEQLVRQLEREVTALESRGCSECEAREARGYETADEGAVPSDTESEVAVSGPSLAREQLERAEAQLQARIEEIAALRQETRSSNLARWRKEREFNDLSLEHKSTLRDLKRLEERLSMAHDARKTAEQKTSALQTEMDKLKPQYEETTKELERVKDHLDKLKKTHETAQAEVDRSRNDIRKLKSELQYSEKRRLHAEEQEELSSRERAQLRDELVELRAHNNNLVQNNKALQEACGLLEDQLTDLEKLADINEIKNKELESEVPRMRSALCECRARLAAAESQLAARAADAERAARSHRDAHSQADQLRTQLHTMTERVERSERRAGELETALARAEGERREARAALEAAARRAAALQEDGASLRTRAHHHHALALQLQAQLHDVQEELSAAREAAEAATVWWRTRETKAEATLRQQAKLIDFLQAKVEEANRKKCSLSNKLFGRSGRRSAASPPLRRLNRELREEVERLRAKLAASNAGGDADGFLHTPKRDKSKLQSQSKKSLNASNEAENQNTLQIVWSDGSRDSMRAKSTDSGTLILNGENREFRAQLVSSRASGLPQNEANRAFTVSVEGGEGLSGVSSTAVAVCETAAERAQWAARLSAGGAGGAGRAGRYSPAFLLATVSPPAAALYVAHNAVALGFSEGVRSLRGEVYIELESETSLSPRRTRGVCSLVATRGRALMVYNGVLVHGGLLALGSALRRASNLKPTVTVSKVRLPDINTPHIVKTVCDGSTEGPCAAVGCGRRVFILRFDASCTEFKIARTLTVDRPPSSLLLTSSALYIAGEKPLKINLPSGALESFGMEDTTIASAAKKHSPPKAILLIKDKPIEILVCYSECGVFVDKNGKRTRNEDLKWNAAVHKWEFIKPFLYAVGEDKITISHITEEVFKAPPCTCDTTSMASTASECYMPDTFHLSIREPELLGTAPNGILIRSKVENGYEVLIVDGMAAFRSIGASVESLDSVSDTKGSSSDLAQSMADISPSSQDVSQESVEATTGFLADIRKRAKQLRMKNRKEPTPDDVIKQILTTEVGLKRMSNGRKSPASVSEFDSDTESEDNVVTDSTRNAADLCADMFTRQVRFQ